MFPFWTCAFFGRHTFPLFFRFFGPPFLGKKEVILVNFLNLGTFGEGNMSLEIIRKLATLGGRL